MASSILSRESLAGRVRLPPSRDNPILLGPASGRDIVLDVPASRRQSSVTGPSRSSRSGWKRTGRRRKARRLGRRFGGVGAWAVRGSGRRCWSGWKGSWGSTRRGVETGDGGGAGGADHRVGLAVARVDRSRSPDAAQGGPSHACAGGASAGADDADGSLDRGAPGHGNARPSEPPALPPKAIPPRLAIIKNGDPADNQEPIIGPADFGTGEDGFHLDASCVFVEDLMERKT